MKKKSRLLALLGKLCISSKVCNHIAGEHHSYKHRVIVGMCIAFIGLTCVQIINHYTEHVFAHMIGELFGYTLHAIGAIPVIERILTIGTTV